MNSIRNVLLGVALVFGSIAAANAEQPGGGGGGGYYGTAEFVGPAGVTVGPYATYEECTMALKAAIAYQIKNHGYVLESNRGCRYRLG